MSNLPVEEQIKELIALCKGSVSITFNEHTTNYQTIEEYLGDDLFDDLTGDEKKAIIEAGAIIEVHAYPKTPVGFILSVHHDLGKALDQAINEVKEY